MSDKVRVSTPDKTQKTVVHWMINDPTDGFNEGTLTTSGPKRKYVSISKNDVSKNPELQGLAENIRKSASIDHQGSFDVDIVIDKKKKVKVQVPFVNIQAQIGSKPNRHTYSHVNVVANKNVGVELIRRALNESLEAHKSRWIVETGPNQYLIQTEGPTSPGPKL
ncbi:hypothetical protein BJX61DRAFT_543671 [Aspergillus egyptiacus]|nr:hypothetical protein BJX61DRAFT_543671 [Aspergillus egyptiacus]